MLGSLVGILVIFGFFIEVFREILEFLWKVFLDMLSINCFILNFFKGIVEDIWILEEVLFLKIFMFCLYCLGIILGVFGERENWFISSLCF